MRCWNCGRDNAVFRSSDGVISYQCDYCGYGFSIEVPDYETMEILCQDVVTGPVRSVRTHWHCPKCNKEIVY